MGFQSTKVHKGGRGLATKNSSGSLQNFYFLQENKNIAERCMQKVAIFLLRIRLNFIKFFGYKVLRIKFLQIAEQKRVSYDKICFLKKFTKNSS